MQTLLSWFESIAFALNDDEPDHNFTRYPLERLVQAYNAGVCLVFKYREDLFTEWRIVKLTPGEYQDVRGCCAKVLEVADQTDEDGNTIKSLVGSRDTNTKVIRNWKKPSCIIHPDAPQGYVIANASLDMSMDGRFKVDPPVPCDSDVYVRVKCVSPPCPITEADVNSTPLVDCTMTTALWYFILARMQAGDRFAEAPFANMQFNHKMFFEILDVVQRQEDKLESPEGA